ncbi:PEP-utilizing enzyme [Ilumatobacter sp.]|uniref:PEP-utilizing enzyme n=1 Tax=Ilumatobacter sp. TaxID=1967498 RepID=UPI003AF7AB04
MTTSTTFDPPGPGQWTLDRSHYPGGVTPISEWLLSDCMAAGMEKVFAEVGVPARRIEARFVNGFMYTRLIPLIGGDRPPGKLPPAPVLKIATRLHPAFRARAKAADRSLTDRTFVEVVREWSERIRPRLVGRNRELQATDLAGITDPELDRHVADLLDLLHENYALHFELHGHDLGPIARYLHAAIGWGLDPTRATAALAGASPSTARPLARLAEIRRIFDESEVDVRTIDDARAVSPEAAALIDAHLNEYGSVLATGYDITAFTLGELPGVLLGSIRTATPPTDGDHEPVIAELRAQVPADARTEFDERLADARSVMDMRDDNGPLTVEWPTGLLRLALLEVGRRLVTRGAVVEPEHALELTPDEARRALSGTLPTATEIAERSEARIGRQRLDPPNVLGPDEPEPPLDVMPKPLAEMVATVQTALAHLGMDGATPSDPYVGVGIGEKPYTGRARTAATADEAIEKLEPGDVLVVRATSPAFNAVLTVAGAVVTANGGALSHAAVLARELGIPAVVGAAAAPSIPDGATITVDPLAGRVTVN